MNEKQLTRLSVLGIVVSVFAIYIFVSGIQPLHVKIGEIGFDHVGNTVNVTGTVRDFSISDRNAFFTLYDSTGEIRVVIWSDAYSAMKDYGIVAEDIRDGSKVNLEGKVDVHRGYLEIVMSSPRISLL